MFACLFCLLEGSLFVCCVYVVCVLSACCVFVVSLWLVRCCCLLLFVGPCVSLFVGVLL